mgnify:FL=1
MFYKTTSEEVIKHLNSKMEGLAQEDAKKRLSENGYNELEEKSKTPTWKLFIESFKDPLVI